LRDREREFRKIIIIIYTRRRSGDHSSGSHDTAATAAAAAAFEKLSKVVSLKGKSGYTNNALCQRLLIRPFGSIIIIGFWCIEVANDSRATL